MGLIMVTAYQIGIAYLGACGPATLCGIAHEMCVQAPNVDKSNAIAIARQFIRESRAKRHLTNYDGIRGSYDLTSKGYAYNRVMWTPVIGQL